MKYVATKTQSQQMLNELATASRNNAVNELLLRRAEREAEKLIGVDAYGASLLKGAVATLRFDFDGCNHWHSNAILLDPKNTHPYVNYAISLMLLYRFAEASLQLKIAYELDRADKSTLYLYISSLARAAKFKEANEMLEAWDKLVPDETNDLAVFIREAVAIINSYGLDEHLIYEELHIGIQMLFEKNIIIQGYAMNCRYDGESAWLTYTYIIHLLEDQIMALEDELADRQADRTSPPNEFVYTNIRFVVD